MHIITEFSQFRMKTNGITFVIIFSIIIISNSSPMVKLKKNWTITPGLLNS